MAPRQAPTTVSRLQVQPPDTMPLRTVLEYPSSPLSRRKRVALRLLGRSEGRRGRGGVGGEGEEGRRGRGGEGGVGGVGRERREEGEEGRGGEWKICTMSVIM